MASIGRGSGAITVGEWTYFALPNAICSGPFACTGVITPNSPLADLLIVARVIAVASGIWGLLREFLPPLLPDSDLSRSLENRP
jgi:hypothetical protein